MWTRHLERGCWFGGGSLQLLSVLNKHLDADHFQPMSVCKCSAVIPPCHSSVYIVIDQLTEHTSRRKPSQHTEIRGCFRVPPSTQYTPPIRTQWNEMARPSERAGGRLWVRKFASRESSIVRRYARRGSLFTVDCQGICRSVPLGIMLYHHWNLQGFEAFGRQCGTYITPERAVLTC